ncbi:SRPBCC family protein [Chitinophaga japonensis]|uniref:Polyketide cyclase/dehydrase/lipid transport protein n=1 Tax=Chitinophaga japonensis TaxID=104662 RepID=A0A562T5Z3_CHIJA|nr:SRPBCC family protein [Chitinophaga japonensis]TWI88945.1 polyketide cyclase/dehydrase/lipid transport protein [Chitinophaga japonensis]
MRFIKLLLVSVISFAVLIFLLSLLFPSKAVVDRSGVIDAPLAVVYSQISELKTWPQWNPWTRQAGPSLQFSEPSQGAGAWYTWTNPADDRSSGKLTIQRSDPAKGVYYKMEFKDMKPVFSGLEIKPSENGKSTVIHWYLETRLGWLPWWKFRGFMADRLMGPQVEQGLTELKARCEGMR